MPVDNNKSTGKETRIAEMRNLVGVPATCKMLTQSIVN